MISGRMYISVLQALPRYTLSSLSPVSHLQLQLSQQRSKKRRRKMPGSVLENINDPPIPAPDHHAQSAPLLQPIQVNLPLKPGVQADGADLTVTLHPVSAGPDSISQDIVQFLHAEFSAEILNGCTYPMEEPMSLDKFRDYWFGTFAVVVLKGEKDETEKLLRGQTISSLVTGSGSGSRNWKDLCLGTFYIKPNYPGIFPSSSSSSSS